MSVMVSRDSVKQEMTPAPDGVRIDFYTPTPYKLGTVAIWLNGMKLIREWDDGFTELGSSTVRMLEIPKTGDSLQVEYEEA